MRLTDRVEVITATKTKDSRGGTVYDYVNPASVVQLPGEVTSVTSSATQTGGRTVYTEQLRAIIPARLEFDPTGMRIRHRGVSYTTAGDVMLRRRNGRDHHLTIPLRQVT